MVSQGTSALVRDIHNTYISTLVIKANMQNLVFVLKKLSIV